MDKAHDATKLELATRETSLGRVHSGLILGTYSRDIKRVAHVAKRGKCQ
jgi:hypothetical protein